MLSAIISDDLINRIVQIESAGDPNAKAKTSTALGLGQFVTRTWLDCVETHEPELMQGRTRAQILALRTDPAIALRMLARHTEDNFRALGRGAAGGDLYLAHFLGAGTARALLRAAPSAEVSKVVSAKAIKANPSILAEKTCGEVRAWASRKMAVKPLRNWVALYSGPPAVKPLPGNDDDPGLLYPPPVPQADPFLEMIQRRLKALGYHEVGFVDGRPGSRQAAAIAAFKSDRGLPGAAVADADLVAAIDQAEAEGFTRPIAAARAEISERDVAADVPAVAQSRLSRFLAKLGLGGGGTALGLGSAAEYFDGVRDYADPAIRIAAKMPWQLWVAAFLFLLLLIWRSQRTAVNEGVKLVRDGRLT
jgi:hypothetical protein